MTKLEFSKFDGPQVYIFALLILINCAICSAATFEIRGVSNLPSNTLIDLAKISEPTWHIIESEGETLKQILKEVCGKQEQTVLSFLQSETLKLNREKVIDIVLKKGEAVAIPFCLKVETNVPITIKPKDTLESILKHNYGVYGTKTIQKTYNLNVPFDLKENIKIEKFNKVLKPGRSIVIPYTSEIKLLRERETSDKKLTDIIGNIENKQLQVSFSQNINPHKSSSKPDKNEFYYIRFLTAEEAQGTPDCILNPITNKPSTFVSQNLVKRYEIELDILRKKNKIANTTIIGIVDTGLGKLGDEFFEKRFFKENESEGIEQNFEDDDDPSNGFKDDLYGINLHYENGDIAFFEDDPDKNHGTQITSLVLGGVSEKRLSNLLKFKEDNWLPIQLKIVNYSKPNGETVEAGSMPSAIDYLSSQKTKIINMSLSNSNDNRGLRNAISTKQDEILFIVASGNQKPEDIVNKLDSLTRYPARYGGRSSPNVLTVGAYNLNKGLAKFSYYSENYVDLLAPGCSVETIDSSGNTVLTHGTSAATAITSFIAGLTASLGLEHPQQIKNRLLASVDVDERLKDSSHTKGLLNPIKAISVRNDVLETNTSKQKYIFGQISDIDNLRTFCGDDAIRKSIGKLRKVRPNIISSDKLEIEYWFQTDGKIEKPQRCPQSNTNKSIGKIRIEGTTKIVDGPLLSDLKDIVIANFRK